MKKEKYEKSIIIFYACLTIFVVAALFVIFYYEYGVARKAEHYIHDKNYYEAYELAERFHLQSLKEEVLLEQAKNQEIHNIVDAIETYKKLDSDYARERIALLSPYAKAAGEYVQKNGDSKQIRVVCRNGFICYEVDNHVFHLGGNTSFPAEGGKTKMYILNKYKQMLTIITDLDSYLPYDRVIDRYISVNSPFYNSNEFQEADDEYFHQVKRVNGKPRPSQTYTNNKTETTGSKSKSKSYSSKKHRSYDPYDVSDYDSAEAFADDKYEEFYDYEDYYDDEDEAYDAAEEYWEDNH